MAVVTISNIAIFMISVCLLFSYFLFLFLSKQWITASLDQWFAFYNWWLIYWPALGIKISVKSVASNIKNWYLKYFLSDFYAAKSSYDLQSVRMALAQGKVKKALEYI